MPFLVFENEKAGTFRLQVSDPRLPRHIQQSLQSLEQVRFDFRGMALQDFLQIRPPDRFPYFFEWQQIELLFDEREGTPFQAPYAVSLNGQDTGLVSRESNALHKLFGTLSLANAVGYTDLAIYDARGQEVFFLQTEVFPQKLNYKTDFRYMIEEISQIIHGLAYDYLRKTYALMEPDESRKPEPLEWLTILKSLSHSLERSLALLLRIPQQKVIVEEQVRIADKVQRPSPKLKAWLRAHPQYLSQKGNRGIRVGKNLTATHLLEQKRRLGFDTPANRFVRWACEQILQQLTPLLPHLSAREQQELRAFSQRLRRRLRHPVLRKVGQHQVSIISSLALHQAAGYRDFYWQFLLLQNGLRLQEAAHFQLDYKQVATLYEYWCFLKTVQILKEDPRYELETQDLIQLAHDGLRIKLQKGQTSRIRFRRQATGEEIHLWYNRRFGEGETYTFSQTPDHFIEFEKSGFAQPFRYVIDAKYRFDRGSENYPEKREAYGPPLEAIAQLHRYRDAILARKEQQTTYTSALKSLGGIILFPYPQEEERFRQHRFFQSQQEVNIGAIPLKPGPEEQHRLFREFLHRLFESPPEALYEQAIEYDRRDQQRRLEEMESLLLIGLIPDDSYYNERLRYHLEQKAWYTPWSKRRELISHVALYDQRVNAIIGFGAVKDYALLNADALQRLGATWPHRLRQKPYICYYWEDWQDCHLPYQQMRTGGVRFASYYGMQLALRYQQTDCLALEGYPWFRVWEEIHAIDPNCRLVKHNNRSVIRFQYQNQNWRCQKNEDSQFVLVQPKDIKQVYDLRTPLSLWLKNRKM
jgi:predicted component of viral defense system (DUF524 family)